MTYLGMFSPLRHPGPYLRLTVTLTQREQRGWLGDAQPSADTNLYNPDPHPRPRLRASSCQTPTSRATLLVVSARRTRTRHSLPTPRLASKVGMRPATPAATAIVAQRTVQRAAGHGQITCAPNKSH